MPRTKRRQFLQSFAAAALGTRVSPAAFLPRVDIVDRGGFIEAVATHFMFRYTRATDLFELFDDRKRLVLSAPLQPIITEQVVGQASTAAITADPPQAASSRQTVFGDRINFEYTLGGSAGEIALTLRIAPNALWFEPITYTTRRHADIVSVHYFAQSSATKPKAGLQASFLVVPGISEGSSVSPIQSDEVGLNETVWLGRGSSPTGLNQQWALPVHYFCGFSKHELSSGATRDIYTKGVSDAFTCGLADLPNGDLFLTLDHGRSTLWIDYRSDLWHHIRGPARLQLGATLCLTVAYDYYAAIHAYYAALLDEKIVAMPAVSPRKLATMLSPQFCTWGSQVVRGNRGDHLSEAYLEEIYAELQRSGMKAALFSIDDKWEGSYGALTHDTTRLPHFERFLDRVRSDGLRIGLWTALMRCEKPADLGLTLDNLLQDHAGRPIRQGNDNGYYLLDFTQPTVAAIVQDLARAFMRRYKPDLVKFDFGYELPNVSQAAPADRSFMGERFLTRGLELVIPALREVNSDVVVMYYNLSPLYLAFFDLHGLDDIFQAYREFSFEANRRLYFSGLLGSLGVPTYGSSGYDWASASEIWFDSAASGSIGSLNDFIGDEAGERPTPQIIARYNGVARVLRQTRIFDIVPIGGPQLAPTQGAHAHSWVRLEADEPVLLARRPDSPFNSSPNLSAREFELSNLAVANFPLIVASTSAQAISSSLNLITVCYGEGPISIRTVHHGLATIRLCYLGGKVTLKTFQIIDGWLRFTCPPASAATPLEYIEIRFNG